MQPWGIAAPAASIEALVPYVRTAPNWTIRMPKSSYRW
jgi:hypothetical protein